jgi:hypothetical protein
MEAMPPAAVRKSLRVRFKDFKTNLPATLRRAPQKYDEY